MGRESGLARGHIDEIRNGPHHNADCFHPIILIANHQPEITNDIILNAMGNWLKNLFLNPKHFGRLDRPARRCKSFGDVKGPPALKPMVG